MCDIILAGDDGEQRYRGRTPSFNYENSSTNRHPLHEGRRTKRGLLSGMVIFKSIPRGRGYDETGVHTKIVRSKSNTNGTLR